MGTISVSAITGSPGAASTTTGTITEPAIYASTSSSGAGGNAIEAVVTVDSQTSVYAHNSGSSGYAVIGEATGSGSSVGGYFSSAGTGQALYATTSNGSEAAYFNGGSASLIATVQIYGPGPSLETSGGALIGGELSVAGTGNFSGYLTKSGGGFRIDNPVDPANSFLNHEFVESDIAKNVYTGNAVLDDDGSATVKMDAWFSAVNSDPVFSLAPKAASMPNLFWDQVDASTFKIGGGIPGGTVSWTLHSVRSDAWQKANRSDVVIPKTGDQVGKYRHPSLFGKDDSFSLSHKSQPSAAPDFIRR